MENEKKQFINFLKNEKRRSKYTVLNFESELKAFTAYLERVGIKDFRDITTRHIRRYCSQVLIDGKEASTLKTKISRLNVFFSYLRLRHNYTKSPVFGIKPPKVKKRKPLIVVPKLVDDLADFIPKTYLEKRDYLIVQLFVQTGIRRSELVGLQNRDIDLVEKTIKVKGKGNKERLIPIGDKLSIMMREYQILKRQMFNDNTNDSFFLTNNGEKLSVDSIYVIVRTQMSELNIPKKSPHVLRHIFASILHQNGADIQEVQELLGHASVGTTQLYIHDHDSLKRSYLKYFPDLKKIFKKNQSH